MAHPSMGQVSLASGTCCPLPCCAWAGKVITPSGVSSWLQVGNAASRDWSDSSARRDVLERYCRGEGEGASLLWQKARLHCRSPTSLTALPASGCQAVSGLADSLLFSYNECQLWHSVINWLSSLKDTEQNKGRLHYKYTKIGHIPSSGEPFMSPATVLPRGSETLQVLHGACPRHTARSSLPPAHGDGPALWALVLSIASCILRNIPLVFLIFSVTH